MKDIVVKGRFVKREIIYAVSCFLLSFCINIGAVIAYSKPWVEIFSQIGYVVVIAVVFYVVIAVFRCLFYLIKRIITK